jgi:hypothetical protein
MKQEQEKATWGGAREGAGRKAYAADIVPVSWRISKTAKRWIATQAREQGVTTARILDELIRTFEEKANE